MRRSAILGLVAAVVVGASAVAALAETGAGLRWQLGFKHETPTWIKVKGLGDDSHIAWYMTYTVENKTGAARKPAIRAVLLTDTDKKFPDSGDSSVLEAVKKKLDVKELSTAVDVHKGIEDGVKVACVATFGDVDKYAKKIELRVYGLMDPVTTVKGKEVYEIRYWQVKYERKGDEFDRTEDPWKTVSSGWVTEEPKKDAK